MMSINTKCLSPCFYSDTVSQSMETLAEIHNSKCDLFYLFGNIHFVKIYPTLNLHYDQKNAVCTSIVKSLVKE